MNLTTRDNGQLFVEQPGQRSEQPAFCLAAQAEQDEIVTGQDGVDDLRDNRFIVTDDAREEWCPGLLVAHPRYEVLADLIFHRTPLDPSRCDGLTELGNGGGKHLCILPAQRLRYAPCRLCRGLWFTRTAAGRRSVPRTRLPPLTTACPSARTVSSSMCTCRATAPSSCITTIRSNVRPAYPAWWRIIRRTNWRGSTPASHSSPGSAGGSNGFPYRGLGLGIPRLRDVLSRYPSARCIIELKTSEPELVRRTIDDIRAASAVDRVALGSFYWRALNTARAYEPRIPTGASKEETRWALYRSWVRLPLGRTGYREFQVPEHDGSEHDRHSPVHRPCPPFRPAGEDLDGQRRARHATVTRLGR